MPVKKCNPTRKSSCVTARGLPPAAQQVLALLSRGTPVLTRGGHPWAGLRGGSTLVLDGEPTSSPFLPPLPWAGSGTGLVTGLGVPPERTCDQSLGYLPPPSPVGWQSETITFPQKPVPSLRCWTKELGFTGKHNTGFRLERTVIHGTGVLLRF